MGTPRTLALNLSITGTITEAPTPPPIPLAVVGYNNADYSINGVVKTQNEMVSGIVNCAIVPGEGLQLAVAASVSDFVYGTPELSAAVTNTHTGVFEITPQTTAPDSLEITIGSRNS